MALLSSSGLKANDFAILMIIFLLSFFSLKAQIKNYELNEIVITASKAPITISNLTRM